MSTALSRIDRTTAAYKKERIIVLVVVITLTVLGGTLLGFKISLAEQAKQSGEMESVLKEKRGKIPGPEHGMMQ